MSFMDFLNAEQLQALRAPLRSSETSEILERLNTLFQHDWSLELEVFSVEHPTVRARLKIKHIVRDGLGQADALKDAERQAISNAAQLLGMGTETDVPTVSTDQPSPLPEKPKAHQHIDDMLEKCREAGLSKEALRYIINGYGTTVEESRQIYVSLRELLKKHGHHA